MRLIKILILVISLLTVVVLIYNFLFPNESMAPQLTDSVNNGVSNLMDSEPKAETKFPKKASFSIYTNGTLRTFSSSMYHNLSETVYISAENPNQVVVNVEGVTWGDFFSTLPFSLTEDCLVTGAKQTFCNSSRGTLKFYINGEQVEGALNKVINDGDKLLVSFGNESEVTINSQINNIP